MKAPLQAAPEPAALPNQATDSAWVRAGQHHSRGLYSPMDQAGMLLSHLQTHCEGNGLCKPLQPH